MLCRRHLFPPPFVDWLSISLDWSWRTTYTFVCGVYLPKDLLLGSNVDALGSVLYAISARLALHYLEGVVIPFPWTLALHVGPDTTTF